MQDAGARTRERILTAATALFAERGFHGTKIRDITARAGVNVASGNYHFGSKRDLYLTVFRSHFGQIRELIDRRGAAVDPRALDRLPREGLERLLEARVRIMLEILVGPHAGPHGALLQREILDPSGALPVVVQEFISPLKRELEEIVARLMPAEDGRTVERTVLSIVGQAQFLRLAMPVVLVLLGRTRYPRAFAAEEARHIATFSLGGIERVARRGNGRGKARARA